MVAVYFLYTLGCFLAALFNISSFLSIEKKKGIRGYQQLFHVYTSIALTMKECHQNLCQPLILSVSEHMQSNS